ncbi:hypothetical protein [Tissierella sp.]|uniref:hypothetical protein n=1 Tax=Tissierella sp. TaxID=41274 RepID=UPI002861F91F|nr:hypothetical protein [Tissierella sp.]MDR7856073.1 hypothetical protein [Tissierella sp.]
MQDKGFGTDSIALNVGMAIGENAKWQPKWTIEKYDKDMNLYDIEKIEGNLLLNEGITSLLTLLIGGSETPFNNANAHIGVGDGTTAAVNTQTGLLGTNKSYAPMDATYPQVSGNVITFRSTFGPDDGNHNWREFTVANGVFDSAKNLNRKVESALRTKGSPDTWVIQLQVTIS